jgi:hypothetical protein
MSRFISARLPTRVEAWQVLGLVAFVVFSWTIVGFFYQIPSIRLFMDFSGILAVLSYRLAFALLESILVTGVLVLLAALLPAAAFKRGFAYKAFLLILTGVVASLLFERYYTVGGLFYSGAAPSYRPAALFAALCILMLVVLLLLVRMDLRMRRAILAIVDRISLFAYLYVPLGMVAVLVVILRILL